MVFQWIGSNSRTGGGWLRRYLQLRRDLLNIHLRTNDFIFPYPPLTLFDFSRSHDASDASVVGEKDADGWRVGNDQVIGGFSTSRATFVKDDSSNDVQGRAPFIRWEGRLDTTVGLQSHAHRSGFAALRSPEFPFGGANLHGFYDALEVKCRSDARVYTLNLKVSTAIPGDIYQHQVQSLSSSFEKSSDLTESDSDPPYDTFVIPFTNFYPASAGRGREIDRELDNKICIESIGVVLMDGLSGDFRFDLARIRAVNLYEGRVFEKPPQLKHPPLESITSSEKAGT